MPVVLALLGCSPTTHENNSNSALNYYAQLARCSDEKFLGNLDVQIDACSWLLKSEKLPDDKVNYIWLMRGWARYAKGDYEEAISDLSYYVEAMPEINQAPLNKQTYIYLAHERIVYAHAQLGETDIAIEKINAVIEMDSHQSSAYQARGKIYHYIVKDLDKAVADFSRALQGYRHKDVLEDRADAYLELKEYENAIRDFKEAIEGERYPRDALNGLAWFLATTSTEFRNAKDAIHYAKKLESIVLDPRFLDTIAAAYAASGIFSKAEKTQQKALESKYRFPPLTDDERLAFERRLALYESGKALYCPGMAECD